MAILSSEKIEDQLKRALVLAADEDYADLSTFARVVEEILDLRHAPESVYRKTLGTVYELLQQGLVVAGVPTTEGEFVPWTGGIVDTMSRMQSGWESLGRSPDVGEIVWFDATEKGEKFVEGQLPDD